MKEIELQLCNPECVEIPAFLASSSLKLEEIGAVVCLVAMGNMEHVDRNALLKRLESDEFKAAGKRLHEVGVINYSREGDKVNIELDLDNI